jgi:hypothetical protein
LILESQISSSASSFLTDGKNHTGIGSVEAVEVSLIGMRPESNEATERFWQPSASILIFEFTAATLYIFSSLFPGQRYLYAVKATLSHINFQPGCCRKCAIDANSMVFRPASAVALKHLR